MSTVDDLMKAARGLSSNTVCRLLEKQPVFGVNYRGCGKRYIFEDLLDRTRDDAWLATFVEQLRKEPRPKKRSERKREKESFEAAQAAERQREADEFAAKGQGYEDAIAQAEYLRDIMLQARSQLSSARESRIRYLRIARTLDPKRYVLEDWPPTSSPAPASRAMLGHGPTTDSATTLSLAQAT